MPYIFNPSVLSVHNIPEPTSEVNPSKIEQTSVQSRGTSPMLPATDSSNEENEDCNSQPDYKIEKVEEKTDEFVTENDEPLCKIPCKVKFTSDLKEEILSDQVPECEIHNEKDKTENSKLDIDEKDETPKVEDKLVDSVCDKKECDLSELKHDEVIESKVSVHNICENEITQTSHEKESVSETQENEPRTQQIDPTIVPSKSTDNSADNEVKVKPWRTSKSDRNIFSDLNEYNPFTDPQILEATGGLELLSTLAEKSSLSLNTNPEETKLYEKPEANTVKEDVFTFKEDAISTSKFLHTKKETDKETIVKPPMESKKPIKARIKCGYAFKPTKAPEPDSSSPVRMTTFCGITIPEG